MNPTLEKIVGMPVALTTIELEAAALVRRADRRWAGACAFALWVHAEALGEEALSTYYYLRVVRAVWLADHHTYPPTVPAHRRA